MILLTTSIYLIIYFQKGYGAAIKKGLTFNDLEETVGIHPTSAEEIVTLSVTKSSGGDAAAGGCWG